MVTPSNNSNSDVVLEVLASPAFSNIIKLIMQPLEEKINRLQRENEVLTSKIHKLENISKEVSTKNIESTKNDKIHKEITERNMNLIISGLEEETAEDLKKRVTLLFEAKFQKKEIAFDCTRIGLKQDENQDENKNQRPRSIRVKFYNIWDRREIYLNRITALKQTGIYMNEDLTRINSQLAYKARKLKRDKKIHQTWTMMGRVFVKETEESEPKEFTLVLEQQEHTEENASPKEDK